MSRVLDKHRLYLSDGARLSAFQSAIAEAVRPGDVVLDLGSGTGILGLMAARAGAARVYAIDAGGMAHVARAIVRANGYEDRITVIDGFSTSTDLPERATLLVTDQIGHFGFDAGLVGYVADARRRLLRDDAKLVPSRIDLWVAPLEAPDVLGALDFWNERPGGFRMDPVREMTMNSGHPRTVDSAALLGSAQAGGHIDLSRDTGSIAVEADLRVARSGALHGIAGWFGAQLSPGVAMTNSPLDPAAIRRRAAVFPIAQAVSVSPGDCVRVRMRILPDDAMVGWTVEVRHADGGPPETFSHSTLRGMLIAPEKLARTRPDFVPSLSERGRARLTVLELCDGRRPLADIERTVFERHRSLFADHAAAAFFVAEVVTGYTR